MKKEENNVIELNWKDLKWKKEKYKNLFLLSLPNQPQDYYRLIKEYGNFFSTLILKVNNLNIFTIKPIIHFALFPEEIFSEKTQVPFSWATGCVRSTSGKTSDVLCYKYLPYKEIPIFDKLTADLKRGDLHELLHIFFSQQINSSGSPKFIRSINEGFCEFVPRILFNLQMEIKDSTDYLTSLNKKDIISFKDIDQYGMAHFSSEKINKNVAYASSFLGIMWLAKKLSKSQKGNYLSGTKKMLDLLTKCQNKEQVYTTIKIKTKTDFLNSKLPMLESINELKEGL
jgi:hypothetical protein